MKKFTALPRSFYEPSAAIVAEKLLGHWLIRNTPDGLCGGPIVETEAYLTGDPAAHSFIGRTKRNQIMWEHPGYCYVYFIYGNYWCCNAVCQPEGIAEAVLIRAVDPVLGLDLMGQRRQVSEARQLTNGPGKLCTALGIDRDQNGVDLCDPKSALFIAENKSLDSFLKINGPVVITTRVGITKAAALPLRFYFDRSPFVSRKTVVGSDVSQKAASKKKS